MQFSRKMAIQPRLWQARLWLRARTKTPGPVQRAVTWLASCGALAAGAGFGMFLIALNRAGSAKDLWPAGIADLAGVITAVGVSGVARQLAPPPPGTRRLALLAGLIAAMGTLSVFLAAHRGLLAV